MAAIATPPLMAANIATPVQRPCRDTIRKLVASLAPSRGAAERRGDRRFPYPYPVRISPVVNETVVNETVSDIDLPAVDPGFTVIGKHLSETGLGFYHQEPLPFRRVQVWLGSPIGLEVELIMDLSWCRFVGKGWYVSGGRFVETIKG